MASSLSLDLLEADTEYWSATRSLWVKSIPSVPATILPPLEAILVISERTNIISSKTNIISVISERTNIISSNMTIIVSSITIPILMMMWNLKFSHHHQNFLYVVRSRRKIFQYRF